jgi:hypothetical protein
MTETSALIAPEFSVLTRPDRRIAGELLYSSPYNSDFRAAAGDRIRAKLQSGNRGSEAVAHTGTGPCELGERSKSLHLIFSEDCL